MRNKIKLRKKKPDAWKNLQRKNEKKLKIKKRATELKQKKETTNTKRANIL